MLGMQKETLKSYKELKVWQKALGLVVEMYGVTKTFPQVERFGLISQMNRAAVSIPSNIAEGWGRGMTKEYLRFLRVARGSLMELETQLIIAHKLQYLPLETANGLTSQIEEVGRMLNGLMKSLRS